jgi:hypothetical protein
MDAQDTAPEKLGSPLDRPLIGPQIEPRPPELRSRITNHRELLPGVNGRSAPARRFRDLVSSYIVDMGGLEYVSEIKLGLIRRLAAATVQAEIIEARMVNGEKIDVGTLCTLASTTVRIASRLGLERVAKPVDLYRDILPQLKHERSNGGGDDPA